MTTAACGLLAVAGALGQAPDAVKQVLGWTPTQKGVVVGMPTPAEQAKCTVSGDAKARKGQNVWLLKDGNGQVLRRFVDTNGDGYPDVYSYYKDGLEVYREIDSKFTGKSDRFYWLNTAGSRIGVSTKSNGVIDVWQSLSLEELSQEVMLAVATKDWNRYAALLVTDEDLSRIGVAAGEAERIKKNLAAAQGKFQQVAVKFGLNESSKWVHVETGQPSRLLAETTGWKQDAVIHARVMVLCDTAGKTEYIQLADVVQVGDTWKLLDAPTTIDTPLVAGGSLGQGGAEAQAVAPAEDGAMQKLLKELADVDTKVPQDRTAGANPAEVAYHKQRAEVINRIIAACPEKDRENWYKQIIDSLSAIASASDSKDKDSLQMFQNYAGQLAKQAPGSEIAGYASYRLLVVENSREMLEVKNAKDHQKAQTAFAEKLTQFVNGYPAVSDAPEALQTLGGLYEMLNKEAEAQKCYELVTARFASSKQAAKAVGAIRRLTSLGKNWDVGANVTVLNGDGTPYNAGQLRGRTVVIYYWATFCNQAAEDFARMQKILQPLQAKGVVLVAVNVDDKDSTARAFLQKNSAAMPPSLHLHSPGGFDSPAAVQYGLSIFPAMFLMDSSGKIVSRTLDVATLEEELQKVMK